MSSKRNYWGVITPATPVITRVQFPGTKTSESSLDSSFELAMTVQQPNRRESDVFTSSSRKFRKKPTKTFLIVYQKEGIDNKSWKNCVQLCSNYTDVAQPHGIRYITEDRSIIERVFWLTFLMITLAYSAYSIYSLYDKYSDANIIVSFVTHESPVHDIPFPALTICTESKSIQRVFSYMKSHMKRRRNETLSDWEFKMFQYIYVLCEHRVMENIGEETFDEDFYKTIEKLHLPLPEYVFECKWMGQKMDNCRDILTPVITDEGICYSFNTLHHDQLFRNNVINYRGFFQTKILENHWDIKGGYKKQAGVETYPKRGFMEGAVNSLEIRLKQTHDDFDHICKKSLQGYRVRLHAPTEIPRMRKSFITVPFNAATAVSVYPRIVKNSEEVNGYATMKRMCFFENERRLKYFKFYTKKNCMLECLSNFTSKKCGCAPFFTPRDNNTKICGSGKYACGSENNEEFEAALLHNKMRLQHTNDGKDELCNCLPLCTELQYETDTSDSDWDWYSYYTHSRHSKFTQQELNNCSMSLLSVFFGTNYFFQFERTEVYSIYQLIANMGGIVNLFTGFSIITILELVYYWSLRLCCNKWLFGDWTGNKVEQN